MQSSPLTSMLLFHIGPVAITRPVVTTWIIIALLVLVCRFVTRRLAILPDGRQAVLEGIVTGITSQIVDVIRKDPRPFLPLVGTCSSFWWSRIFPASSPASKHPPARSKRPPHWR